MHFLTIVVYFFDIARFQHTSSEHFMSLTLETASSAPAGRTFAINPVSPIMGAEVVGLDITKPISDEVFAELQEAFVKYMVLCFRDQHLTEEQLVAFSTRWGSLGEHIRPGSTHKGFQEINVMSNADANGKPNGKHTDETAKRWHTDRSFMQKSALATFLYGVTVPSSGGDTLFSNAALAYDELSPDMKARIAPLRAIHSIEHSRKARHPDEIRTDEEVRRAPPVLHPLAKPHPVTGRKALYIGAHAWKVADVPEKESEELLASLLKHATQDRFVYAHKWCKGDLVMWDNRDTLHAATDFDGARELRVMWRTIVSDAPTVLA